MMTSGALDLTGYKLTFDDEFNTFSWNGGGNKGTWSTAYSYGERKLNDEQQLYTDATLGINPFTVQGGALHITAAPTTDPSKTWGQPYSSGVITTYGTFSQQYGVFEMRAKLPQGQGLWPAFWLLPVQHVWPPELDVLEGFGNRADQMHWGALTATAAGNKGDWVQVPADVTNGYHTYAVRWTPETLTYYFDGQPVAQTATPADMNQPMYLIANLAVGGQWAGNPTPDTRLPASLDIDYIRAYSDDPAAVAVAPQRVSTPDTGRRQTPAAPHSAPPRLSAAPTNWIDRTGTTGTAGNDSFQTFYGDTAPRAGGPGDDTYTVTDPRMWIAEKPGEGTDTVRTWVDYTLPANVENLLAAGDWGMHLTGNALSNIIVGGRGDDTLAGGRGDDVLWGGGGANRFVVEAGGGYDTIADFQAGSALPHDTVLLSGYSYRTPAEVLAHLRQDGADTVLTFSNGETLTFWNTAAAAFTADDFLVSDVTTPPAFAPPAVPVPAPVVALAAVTVGSGPDRVVLTMSEDAYLGDAQFTVSVDGQQVGGVQTVQAAHVSGETQDFVVQGAWGKGAHTVSVNFLNDKWDGGLFEDRNLYVKAVTYNGVDQGQAAAMQRGGPYSFQIAASAIPVPALPPDPAPTFLPKTVGTLSQASQAPAPSAAQPGPGSAEHKVAAANPAGVWAHDAGAAQVARLYDAVLGRLPDAAGLAYWTKVVDGGTATLRGIAEAFIASPEYRAVHGALSNADFVQAVYRNTFGHPASVADAGEWTARLGAGLSRAAMVVSLSESPGHTALTAPDIMGGAPGQFGIKLA